MEIYEDAAEMLSTASRHLRYNVSEAETQTAERQLLAHLDMLMDLQEKLTDQLRDATLAARAAGSSWADVAGHLGMTRQAAQQKYGKKAEKAESIEELPLSDPVFDVLFTAPQLRDEETAAAAEEPATTLDEDLAAIAAEHVARAAAKNAAKKPGFKNNEFQYKKGHRTMSYLVFDRATGQELGMVYRDSGTTWAARTLDDQQVLSDYPGGRDTAAGSLRK